MTSRTRMALAYMKTTGCSTYAAARQFKLAPSTLYEAVQKPTCPNCGAFLTRKPVRADPTLYDGPDDPKHKIDKLLRE
jgi:hypothetical protein